MILHRGIRISLRMPAVAASDIEYATRLKCLRQELKQPVFFVRSILPVDLDVIDRRKLIVEAIAV